MMHEQLDPGYRQRLYLPAIAAATGARVHVEVLGRLRGSGRFDHMQQSPRSVIHVIESGRGWVEIAGQTAALGAGDGFAFLPGDRAHYREDPTQPWRYTWFGLGGPDAEQLLRDCGFGEIRTRSDLATAELWTLADELERDFASDATSPYRAPAAAWRLADLIVPRQHTAASADPAVNLRAIIDSGYALCMGIEEMASRMAIDRSTLYRRFRRAYGCSPQHYLLERRLERAELLLRRGEQSVQEIAGLIGYSDHRAFARAFRKRFGRSPCGRS